LIAGIFDSGNNDAFGILPRRPVIVCRDPRWRCSAHAEIMPSTSVLFCTRTADGEGGAAKADGHAAQVCAPECESAAVFGGQKRSRLSQERETAVVAVRTSRFFAGVESGWELRVRKHCAERLRERQDLGAASDEHPPASSAQSSWSKNRVLHPEEYDLHGILVVIALAK
jgi:hypothetical protein